MTHRRLPGEVVSLIHHVELNQSGWWKKAVSQISKGLLWRSSTPISAGDLQMAFRSEIGYEIGKEQIDQQIDLLISTGEASRLPDGRLKLTEEAREKLSLEIEHASSQQEECKRYFVDDIKKYCPGMNAEETWEAFSAVLGKAIGTYGANAFHMMVDGRLQREGDWIERFIEEREEYRNGLSLAVRNMFDPERLSCRAQILRLMSANFFADDVPPI